MHLTFPLSPTLLGIPNPRQDQLVQRLLRPAAHVVQGFRLGKPFVAAEEHREDLALGIHAHVAGEDPGLTLRNAPILFAQVWGNDEGRRWDPLGGEDGLGG
jgi:hypothetical protein